MAWRFQDVVASKCASSRWDTFITSQPRRRINIIPFHSFSYDTVYCGGTVQCISHFQNHRSDCCACWVNAVVLGGCFDRTGHHSLTINYNEIQRVSHRTVFRILVLNVTRQNSSELRSESWRDESRMWLQVGTDLRKTTFIIIVSQPWRRNNMTPFDSFSHGTVFTAEARDIRGQTRAQTVSS